MRTITNKDKRGLLVAIRVFLRHLNGERLSQQAGFPLIEKALEAGLSFDVILNPDNWKTMLKDNEGLVFADYIDALCAGSFEARPLKKSPGWHENENGFDIVAEAAHDFFLEVSGNGGKWNIPSALTNLAKAINEHSLQAILSEKLILEVMEKDEDVTYFNYILAIVKDFKTLSIEDEPEEKAPEEKPAVETEETHEEEAPEDAPEDEPYPEIPEGFEETTMLEPDYNEEKRKAVITVIGSYTPGEMLGIIETIDGGIDMPIDEVVKAIVMGRFDVKKESTKAREVHRQINSDLMTPFIDCANIQGVEMNESLAADYDILHDSWDLRDPQTRRYRKLLKLILTEGKEDSDLLDSINDLEKLYKKK